MTFGLREPFPGNPPPLTTRPEGLLSMLGLQTNGRYPQHLQMDWLAPVLDLGRWYQEAVATFKTGSFNSTGTGNFVTDSNLTVPNGEHWLVLEGSFLGNAAIAGGATFMIGRTNSTGGSFVPLSDRCVTEANGHVSANTNQQAIGVLLRPSVRYGIHQLNGVAAIALTYCLRYVRLTT